MVGMFLSVSIVLVRKLVEFKSFLLFGLSDFERLDSLCVLVYFLIERVNFCDDVLELDPAIQIFDLFEQFVLLLDQLLDLLILSDDLRIVLENLRIYVLQLVLVALDLSLKLVDGLVENLALDDLLEHTGFDGTDVNFDALDVEVHEVE